MSLFTIEQLNAVDEHIKLTSLGKIIGLTMGDVHSAEHLASVHHIELSDIKFGSASIESECRMKIMDSFNDDDDWSDINDDIRQIISTVARVSSITS